ncbi:MAG TPA: isoaspartyl peptidase/L-asparaginase [Bacteroidia bacterium]
MFTLAIHGGAGTIERSLMTPELEAAYLKGLSLALKAGRKVLEAGGTSLDAVVASVIELENYPMFNAGKGAVYNHIGSHEMDAAVMEGKTLMAGAACGVTGVKNPILLAKGIMQQSEHVMMACQGAEAFAKSIGLEFESAAYFDTEHRYKQWLELKDGDQFTLDHSKSEKKMGTVGAVALDKDGNLAAATSTGGMTNKKFGRIGDSPVIGAGTYANNETCAISCTGHGELFLRSVVAYDISCLMAYKGLTLKEACDKVVMDKLVKIGGEGGLIALDTKGNIELPFNSSGMYRASVDAQGNEYFGIYR